MLNLYAGLSEWCTKRKLQNVGGPWICLFCVPLQQAPIFEIEASINVPHSQSYDFRPFERHCKINNL